MSVMVDRVATALWVFMPASSKNDEQRARMKSLAQVALEQLRHPTATMCAALSDAIADGVSDERKIQAVVDAALKGPEADSQA